MAKRFVTIWFRHLLTDWFTLRHPMLKNTPFVFATPVRGQLVITAANPVAMSEGMYSGLAVADARALIPSLQVFDDKPGRTEKLLHALAVWCIRYTPIAAVDFPHGIILDASGCAHLWGGEKEYLLEINRRLKSAGYQVRTAMAGTVGASWAIAHYEQVTAIIETGKQVDALLSLPPAALRLPDEVTERLHKLGFDLIHRFLYMPRQVLRRRFGAVLLRRIDEALGKKAEIIQSVVPVTQYQERLSCLEAITTATGIEIALKKLLGNVCYMLQQTEKGLRKAVFTCYRLDDKIVQVEIGTNRASNNALHLFKLFENKINSIAPGDGIEMFMLEALKTEDLSATQEKLWANANSLTDTGLAQLLDRVASRLGEKCIHRYLPAAHYWPERSIKLAADLMEQPTTHWQTERPRPTQLLLTPIPIEVMAPVPDYPPMLFRYKGVLHKIKKADGPERIEREWWLDEGPHRDYYYVEDEAGERYWIFRSGHYMQGKTQHWFLHGFFA